MNLNDLSANDLDALENYINDRIGKCEPEIQILFQDLKNGKLNNKNVDSDALDFVYDGLTNLVENWVCTDKEPQTETISGTTDLSSDLKNLFERNLEFHSVENNQLQDTVEKLLMQNDYPPRSKNINLSGTQKPNQKFIKDGFIYLLRGAEASQMSGFFAYPYCHSKLNLEEYCKRNPHATPNSILEEHSQIGKGYFISATTKLPLTAKFCHKVRNKTGSVYVLKMKLEDVYRLEAHKPLWIPNFMNLEQYNEEEYVIPDYVMPNELLKEFEYTDYRGIFKYLTENVGLNITPQDIGFSGDMERETVESIKTEDFLREVEEKIIDDWEKQNYAKMFDTIMKEFGKKMEDKER